MNVYDFDCTVYSKDSSVEFYLYVLKRKPSLLFRCFGKQAGAVLRYKAGKISKEKMKEAYFSFLKHIPADEYVEDFVRKEIKNISPWYLKQKSENDVWISASPYFLVKAFAKKLGVDTVIASDVDIYTGEFRGANCYGEEKCRRFEAAGLNDRIDRFYSDSTSDLPMAKAAAEAYLVKKGKITNWSVKQK